MQNMILAVGPGTPASVVGHMDDNDDDDDDDDEEVEEDALMESEQESIAQAEEDSEIDTSNTATLDEEMNDGEDDDINSSSSSSSSSSSHPSPARRHEFVRLSRRIREYIAGDDMSIESNPSDIIPSPRQQQQASRRSTAVSRPSLRHGGCINTACWLTGPWRLSLVNEAAGVLRSTPVQGEESPTQLATSGDDRLVKFWDVSGAMGTDSPLPGGWNTFCPFATTEIPNTLATQRRWKDYYSRRPDTQLPGSVHNLATLSTGHRGNVFHVEPLHHAPGKVLTCGADGYLRLCDLVAERSSVVVHPFMEEDIDLPFIFHSGMAYSHVMLSANTGLLCSERGLHHFDLRLPPREQSRKSLLKDQMSDDEVYRTVTCKACAVWSPHGSSDVQGEVESSYIFAGGTSPSVGLYDLRMDGSTSRIVERYRPEFLSNGGGVSVSGMDISKDARELLVSYESDQIYTFPIFHQQPGLPDLEAVDAASARFGSDRDAHQREIAAYGGHLNRFTFLKNAKYAGPNDEYICTGSDSGHAWIYDRDAGTVVSLLGADSSTCNGVIPHPDLPFFITYGIDSTAKLWRATPPVDPLTDDSATGRVKCSLNQPYEMSPVTRTWDGVQALVRHIDDEPAIMPDYIASSEEIAASGRFSSPCRRGVCSVADAPRIGNALQALPSILRQNRCECYRAYHDEMDVPVEHPLVYFSHRVSISRLRYQADRLGLKWDAWEPWALKTNRTGETVDPADLVPDNPSDWINFDLNMREEPYKPRYQFQAETYGDVIASMFPGFFDQGTVISNKVPWLSADDDGEASDREGSHEDVDFAEHSRELLYKTALLLKDAGNRAVKEGHLLAAARRYDKAVQYCAVAFMRYFDGARSLAHLTDGHHEQTSSGSTKKATTVPCVWSPLLRILITTRLNMALLFLKPEFRQPERAAGQARAAIKLLAPFTVREGQVVSVRDKKEYVLREDEPSETYREARTLQAKAFFRLGSAELETLDYSAAIKNFEASLKCSPSPTFAKPDSLVVKRLQEAKRKYKTKKKRDRARFQRLLCNNPGTRDTGEGKDG